VSAYVSFVTVPHTPMVQLYVIANDHNLIQKSVPFDINKQF